MYEELKNLYKEIDGVLVSLDNRCGIDCMGYCCKMAESGLEANVSVGEEYLIKKYLRDHNITLPKWRSDVCRFLNETDMCMIYEVRPLSCRKYLCDCQHNAIVDENIERLVMQYFSKYPRELAGSKLIRYVSFE